MSKQSVSPMDRISLLIRTVRGQKVVLDTDLALIFGVPTFRFNEAIKRNRERFPNDFMFQLTAAEAESLTSQIAMSKPGRGGRRTLPYAFTENGAIMAANVLNSPEAVRMSVFVVRAFVKMRELLGSTKELARQLADLETKLTARLDGHEIAIVDVLRPIMKILDPPPRRPIRRGGRLVFASSRKKKPKPNERKTCEHLPAHRHDGSRPDKAYNQDDVAGFIRLTALRLKVAAKVQRKK